MGGKEKGLFLMKRVSPLVQGGLLSRSLLRRSIDPKIESRNSSSTKQIDCDPGQATSIL